MIENTNLEDIKKEDTGVLAKDLNPEGLQELAVSLGLFAKKVVVKMKKADILKAIMAWETKAAEKNIDKETGLRKLARIEKLAVDMDLELDLYNGKLVLSRSTREINGKNYEEILMATGETFINPITK